MIYLSSNLKYLRKQRGLTQEGFAAKSNLKRSLIGAYEEERAEPRISTLQFFADFFKIPLEKLVSVDLEKTDLENIQADFEGKNLRILPILVDDQDKELITLIPIKASAGYLNGYGDPEYIGNLPKFRLPVPELSQNKTYRAFQIKGDSMEPIKPDTYILSEYIDNWKNIKDGKTYIVITKDDGIVYKRLNNRISDTGELVLNSDNPEYTPYNIHVDNVIEVWGALGFISFKLPEIDAFSLKQLSKEVMTLKSVLSKMKKD